MATARCFADCRPIGDIDLVQGTGQAKLLAPREAVAARVPSVPDVPPVTEQARVVLGPRLPVPPLEYESFAGEPTDIVMEFAGGTRDATLVQLWASWCPHCQAEMLEFTQRAAELRRSGVRIVALSVDGIGSDAGTIEEAVAAVRDRQFPFATGHATPRLLQLLETLRAELFSHEQPYPVPTSFLVDAQGQVSVIYVGPLSVDQLLTDLARFVAERRRNP